MEHFSYENPHSVFYVDNKRYGESIINQFYTIADKTGEEQGEIEKVFWSKAT